MPKMNEVIENLFVTDGGGEQNNQKLIELSKKFAQSEIDFSRVGGLVNEFDPEDSLGLLANNSERMKLWRYIVLIEANQEEAREIVKRFVQIMKEDRTATVDSVIEDLKRSL